jgi:predicted membrane protein
MSGECVVSLTQAERDAILRVTEVVSLVVNRWALLVNPEALEKLIFDCETLLSLHERTES